MPNYVIWVEKGSREHLLGFGILSEADKAKNYKFGMQIDHDGINEKCKIRPKGS